MVLINFYTIHTSVNIDVMSGTPDYLLADQLGSAGLRSYERLSDKETVRTGQNSCV